MRTRFAILSAMALAFACGLVQAQAPSAPLQGGFRCGGIGQAEQQQFKDEAAQHDALVTFAVTTGAYAGEVDVRITDGGGKVVLEGRCGGPLMLLDLPKGNYQMTAAYEGKAQRKALAVGGAKPTRTTFTWPAG
jgi:hypothetical protein